MGFPFFRPFYNKKTAIRIYRCPISKFVKTMLSSVMTPPYFPIRYLEAQSTIVYANETDGQTRFQIGSVAIESIPLSHPNTGRGYKFIENDKSFVFLTDNELHYDHPGRVSFEEYLRFSTGADLLIHDAEYRPEEYEYLITWGHSTYVHALDLAMAAGVKQLGLFHLNQDRTDAQVDDMVEKSRQIITERGSNLECFAVSCDMEFYL
jgi:ribonuclease BN (tRNA processing enzyme)